MNIVLLMVALLTSCTRIPEGLKPVENFDINRYLGTWYEIARLDNRFEKGLDKISATYSRRADGGIDVLNIGWNPQTREWEKAEGKGYFIEQADKGRLKVSFFGPLYGAYNIINLDKKNYAYSMVTGPNKSYLWILSRTRQLPKADLEGLIKQAKEQGFDTDQLIFARQD
ncbi:outer membrane lipoprotein (lipocalin) [Candidatus Methylobacter favarea]|uniref:Outer membrane lipoprotein Blc n=1 Tax=Candidatus Methylobacter favarea TaxID=2707345 RepID=A0A8S0XLV0_9GAMM|nr:lipocalin family protein [Candidatus Methylobacter favarea]CAA9893002.1 outer membrane lipoprotein (lipocalin) [Candidatus Methylobacter favarea]